MRLLRTYALGAIASAAVALGASVPAAAQSGWTANDDDFLLLQLTLGKHQFLNEVRGYQTNRGVCLDLGDVIQSFDVPIRLDKKSRRATGWLFAEDQTFTIDRDSNTVQNVNIGSAPVQGDIYDTPEGWCVRLEALSRWFGIGLKADLFNSAIRIDDTAKLPFIEAIERRSRAARLRNKKQSFDLGKYPRADAEYKMWRTPSVDVVMRARFTEGPGTSRRETRFEATAAGEVARVSYTARLASDRNLKPRSLRVAAYRNDPDGNLLGPLKATRVAGGDVELLSGQLTGQSVVGRGAFIGNQPLGRTARFSTTTLRGALPAGWDAELYRNGQLIAFQAEDGTGRYEFEDIDLYFGRNEFEVVLYGPQGQVRRIQEDVPVGQKMIEPGKTYYWGGILQQNRDLIDLGSGRIEDPDSGHWRWGVGVERGLDQRTSAGLGYQSFMLAGKRRQYVEATLQRTMGSMHLQLAGAHEVGAGFVTQANVLGKVGRFNLAAFATFVAGSFQSEFAGGDLRFQGGLRADTSLKLGSFQLPIQAGVAHVSRKSGTKVNEFFLGTGMRVLGTSLRAELRANTLEGSDDENAVPETRLRLLASRRLLGVSLRAGADYVLKGRDTGLVSARLDAAKRLDEKSDLNFEIEYDGIDKTTEFGLGYTRDFKHFSLRTDASYRTDGALGLNLSLAFSLGPDPVNGGIRVTDTKLARTGQAAVTVFRDEDGDGRRSPGEEAIKDVYIEAGLRLEDAVTAENGKAIVDGLRPFQPVLVGVDEGSLEDPFLIPSTKGVVIVPRPGVVTQVELAVSPSGEIEGTLLSPNGTEQSGVEIELIDKTGEVIARTVSEFDGFFLFDRIPYGRYRLRVAADAARKLGVRDGLASDVVLGRGNDIARTGVLKLQHGGPGVARLDEATTGTNP